MCYSYIAVFIGCCSLLLCSFVVFIVSSRGAVFIVCSSLLLCFPCATAVLQCSLCVVCSMLLCSLCAAVVIQCQICDAFVFQCSLCVVVC